MAWGRILSLKPDNPILNSSPGNIREVNKHHCSLNISLFIRRVSKIKPSLHSVTGAVTTNEILHTCAQPVT